MELGEPQELKDAIRNLNSTQHVRFIVLGSQFLEGCSSLALGGNLHVERPPSVDSNITLVRVASQLYRSCSLIWAAIATRGAKASCFAEVSMKLEGNGFAYQAC